MNPFKPTAGKTPPMLIGRSAQIEEFAEGLENGAGAPGRLIRVSGARGMGKTVLLNEYARMAREIGWTVVEENSVEGFCDRIVERLMPAVRVRGAQAGPSAFGINLGRIDVERAQPNLRDAIKAKAQEKGRGLLITLDEVQDATLEEMRVLSNAVQHAVREEADIAFVFAGLPSMVESVVHGRTLTFLRRAIPLELDQIPIDDVAWSYGRVMAESGIGCDDAALERMAQESRGYPFMVQLVGYHCWQEAHRASGVLDGALLDAGVRKARERFDSMVIEPALQRLSPSLVRYALAMSCDEGASRTASVAARLGKDQAGASGMRDALLKEHIIESPRRGYVSFLVPYMGEYLAAHRKQIERELGE